MLLYLALGFLKLFPEVPNYYIVGCLFKFAVDFKLKFFSESVFTIFFYLERSFPPFVEPMLVPFELT